MARPENGTDVVPIPYQDVTDEQGMAVYEARCFETPSVLAPVQEQNADSPPKSPPDMNVMAYVVNYSPVANNKDLPKGISVAKTKVVVRQFAKEHPHLFLPWRDNDGTILDDLLSRVEIVTTEADLKRVKNNPNKTSFSATGRGYEA